MPWPQTDACKLAGDLHGESSRLESSAFSLESYFRMPAVFDQVKVSGAVVGTEPVAVADVVSLRDGLPSGLGGYDAVFVLVAVCCVFEADITFGGDGASAAEDEAIAVGGDLHGVLTCQKLHFLAHRLG